MNEQPRLELVGDPFGDGPIRSLNEALSPLAERAWSIHDAVADAQREGGGVTPSMPILFFGDVRAYWWSPLRVVTVGLNPSNKEFPESAPWRRFPGAETAARARMSERPAPDAYLDELSAYFDVAPYREWFDRSFEPLLWGLGASYYRGQASVAVHTDIASPVATNPTWSGLGHARRALHRGGAELWRALVDLLAPDLVVFSVARDHLAAATSLPLAGWDELIRIEGGNRAKPFVVRATTMPVAGGQKVALAVHGRAVNVPFGSVLFEDRERIGASAAARFEAGRARAELGVR